MSYRITEIEDIGQSERQKLQAVGVRTVGVLLRYCANPSGRHALANTSGVDEAQILKWTELASLLQINGVGEAHRKLLCAVGVNSVKVLSTRTPKQLADAMIVANAKYKLGRKPPGVAQVADWIKQAKRRVPKVNY